MADTEIDRFAAEMATTVLAARVTAAAGRPNAGEGREAAGYFAEILKAVRAGLGLDPDEAAAG